MNTKEIRQKFLDFFQKKGHKIVPSSSLIPTDPSVLLTTAGMQQFIPYFTGAKDPVQDFGTLHLCSVQKCFRTADIDKVGDDIHHTFFEMLGNWSIGENTETGYFKDGAIKYALEFFVEKLKLDKNRFWVTVFGGEENILKDKESIKIWKENGIPEERIREFGAKDNLWGPVGEVGPCGPCSEIYYDRGKEFGCGDSECGPNCKKCNRFVELWNLVFMEYFKDEKGSYKKLSKSNVDTGIGFERLVAVLQKKESAYETDLFWLVIQEIENLSSKKYKERKKDFKVIADHIRGACFLVADGVLPSNTQQGYILRRVLRRAIRYGKTLSLREGFLIELAKVVIDTYQEVYPELRVKQADILTVIQKEDEKFSKTLKKGLKRFEKVATTASQQISGKDAFHLYDTYGFPLELTRELAKEKGLKVDEIGFKEAFKTHQEISRAGVEKKFGGHGIKKYKIQDTRYKIQKLHTATHLLHQALRDVLGDHIKQMGSDINPERLRFDFSHSQNLTPEQIKKVQDIVNKKIKEDLVVKMEEMSLEEAIKSGALANFREKYKGIVRVYSIGKYSKEICAGPHVKRTGKLGTFKIIKEQSSSAGVRRIKAILV